MVPIFYIFFELYWSIFHVKLNYITTRKVDLFSGYYDIPSNREFEIMFDVMPSASNHDGPLFAIGTENFAYYEWKTKAVKTQFMVVEFFYSAVSQHFLCECHSIHV